MTFSLKRHGILPMLFLFIFLIGANAQSTKTYKIGQKVDHFSMFDINSKKFATKNVKEKKLIVMVFISNECSYLESVIGNLKSLHTNYNQDIEIWAVNSFDPNLNLNEDEEHMKLFSEKNQLQYIPYLVDLGKDIAGQFSIQQVPSAIILKVEAEQIKLVYSGVVMETINGKQVTTLENNISNLLKGKQVVPSKIKQKFCEIK